MKTSKIIIGLSILIALIAIKDLTAQTPLPKRCKPTADQIYFVDSGQSVSEVRPGSNGGNGYQLNILGTTPDKFQLVKEPYMTSVSLVYATPTQAKWQIFFAPKMGRVIANVKMTAVDCTGRLVQEYRLTESVKLLDR